MSLCVAIGVSLGDAASASIECGYAEGTIDA